MFTPTHIRSHTYSHSHTRLLAHTHTHTHSGAPPFSLSVSHTHTDQKRKTPTGLILFLGMKNQSVFIFFFINNSVSQFGSQRQCYESGSHSLKLHITHGLHFPSCTALTHSRPPLHQSHSCHHSLINSDCLTTPAPHSLTHIKAAHKHSLTAKSCFPLVTFLSVLPFILLSLCLTPDCPTLEL